MGLIDEPAVFGICLCACKAVCCTPGLCLLLLLTELGVDCIEVIGTGAGEGHAWSKVYVDGAWYNVDFCWNDTCGSYTRYLLKSDKYMLRNEHTFDESYWSSTFYAAPEDYRK